MVPLPPPLTNKLSFTRPFDRTRLKVQKGHKGQMSKLINSERRALSFKLRGHGFKSWAGTVGVTIN